MRHYSKAQVIELEHQLKQYEVLLQSKDDQLAEMYDIIMKLNSEVMKLKLAQLTHKQ